MTKDIERDGIKYTLRAEHNKKENCWFGYWVCHATGHTGDSSKPCSSENEALRYADQNLGLYHHSQFLRKKTKEQQEFDDVIQESLGMKPEDKDDPK